jgi:hypothetical protein
MDRQAQQLKKRSIQRFKVKNARKAEGFPGQERSAAEATTELAATSAVSGSAKICHAGEADH